MAKKNSYLDQIRAAQNGAPMSATIAAPIGSNVVPLRALAAVPVPKPDAFTEYCKTHGVSTTGSLAELITAFADCNGTGSDRRSLDYRAAVPVDGEGLLRAFALACPEGYNDCTQIVMGRIVELFGPDARYFLGREGSVALYVAYKPDDKPLWLSRIRADEITLEPSGLFRLWWD